MGAVCHAVLHDGHAVGMVLGHGHCGWRRHCPIMRGWRPFWLRPIRGGRPILTILDVLEGPKIGVTCCCGGSGGLGGLNRRLGGLRTPPLHGLAPSPGAPLHVVAVRPLLMLLLGPALLLAVLLLLLLLPFVLLLLLKKNMFLIFVYFNVNFSLCFREAAKKSSSLNGRAIRALPPPLRP